MVEKTDWVLVEMAQKGDEDALMALRARYEPLVLSIHSQYHFPGLDREEWQQEATVVLWHVVVRFDVSRQRAFGSYYKTALLNSRHDYVRRANAKKRVLPEKSTSIDANPEYFESFLMDVTNGMPDEIMELRQLLLQIMNGVLSKGERSVVMCWMRGLSDQQIMAQLVMSPTQLHNASERVKRKARRFIRKYRDLH